MKYVAAVAFGALLIGLLLSLAVYALVGTDAGHFFAKFLAAPIGLACSFLLFLVYDSIWPKDDGDN